MLVDPDDFVGGLLAFLPQLYDRWEREAIRKLLPQGGTFVDVGSNIGAYSLWAAACAGDNGRVMAIEADPENYAILTENIKLNSKQHVIRARQVGAADVNVSLTFYKAPPGNCGGNNFEARGSPDRSLQCERLSAILKQDEITKVDFMKLDIEGFETRVLKQFFLDVPSDSPLRPQFLLVEIAGGPRSVEEQEALRLLILGHGYALESEKDNALFIRQS